MDASERLIRDFCELMQLGDFESIARGAPLDVNGVTCSLTRSRHDEAGTLVLYCEFGAMPTGREGAVWQELLVQNFLGSPDGGAVFGVSPASRHVICMQVLRAELPARRLADVLHHMADKAQEWRRTYFLESAGGAELRPAAGLSNVHATLGARPGAPRGLR